MILSTVICTSPLCATPSFVSNAYVFPHSSMFMSLRRCSLLPASFLVSSFFFVEKAFATGLGNPVGISLGVPDFRGGIVKILNLVLSYLALLAGIVVIIAGIRLIFSLGDEEAKESAKKTILYAVVGLLIILFAKAIVLLVIGL